MVLTISCGVTLNLVSQFIVALFRPNTFYPPYYSPVNTIEYTLVLIFLMAAALPFAYKFLFKGILSEAFRGLSVKNIAGLCVNPVLLYILFYVYYLVIAETEGIAPIRVALTRMVMMFVGLTSYYISVRLMVDITKRIRTEKNLAFEISVLEHHNQKKTELMRTIAHSIRTPLAVLSSYASLVAMQLRDKDDKDTENQIADDLDQVVYESKQLAELVDSINITVLAEKKDTEYVNVDIGDIVRRITKLFEHMFKTRGIHPEIDVQQDLPLIFGYPEKLTQLLFNILDNVCKYANDPVLGPGECRLTISVKREEGEIITAIADTGQGIQSEILSDIFERGVSGRPGGSGIGLAVCRDIVEEHGGAIEIKSEVNRGTTVIFKIPATI